MKRTEYIRRTLRDICGTAPATPAFYHFVCAMADRVEKVCPFEKD